MSSAAGLRALWDFDDLDATEARLRERLAASSGEEREAVLTQLARVEGLRGRFAEGHGLLEGLRERALALLERGRLLRSAGDAEAALPLFEAAWEAALAEGDEFAAADAAHMAALVSGGEEWAQRGIDLARRSEQAAYWLGPLLNNLGWARLDAGDAEGALDAFLGALEARERDPSQPYEREIARYAVARALRELGRAEEAAPLLEQAIAWTEASGTPDPYFHEELAEAYDALGRTAEAAENRAVATRLRPR